MERRRGLWHTDMYVMTAAHVAALAKVPTIIRYDQFLALRATTPPRSDLCSTHVLIGLGVWKSICQKILLDTDPVPDIV